MFDHSGQQIVMLTIIWWWQKLGRERAVNTQRSQRFRMERLNLKKLNEVEGKEKYCVEVSNRFCIFGRLLRWKLIVLDLLLSFQNMRTVRHF
jgi:hypothetical protein